MSSVLVADPDRELCGVYRQFFAHQGWQVYTCSGALDCLVQLRRYSPRLVILDSQLLWGGADGLLAVMRDDAGLARVPVILTSAEAPLEVLSGSVLVPVVRAFRKPFSLTALLKVMRSELGNGGKKSQT